MDSKKIGAFIAANRKKQGLTQEQLGEKLGVSNKTVSRWENGNYMPDLSLLEPLSRELDITLNELLAGEKIEEEAAAEYSEKNLISAIDYGAEKLKHAHRNTSLCIIAIGVFICICAFVLFPPESSWSSVYSIFGLLVAVAGVFRELPWGVWKRMLASAGLFLVALAAFVVVDYIGVREFKRPPIYRYSTETLFVETTIVKYDCLFYDVYQIHPGTPNAYFLIDTKKAYTTQTLPVSPFNREKSGIAQIRQYANPYVGNNSNTGHLIGALPLAEYGFAFEIDTANCGLIIDYYTTDWYGDEDLYTEKSLIYNSVSAFALLENLEYIRFNFSGSAYRITRDAIEQGYPQYSEIFVQGAIDADRFNEYVEQKLWDTDFVTRVFALFEKIEG